MNHASTRQRLGSLALLVAALTCLYFAALRPWHRTWGTRDGEAQRALPGDEIVPQARPGDGTTHAITIEAPPARVWPWLAQLGQDRGGFYSFEILEDLVGCEMPRSGRILADKQGWKLGDKLWMYPEHKLGGMGHAVLRRLVPGRALGFATRQVGQPSDGPYDGSWSFVLEPQGAHATRLLVRGRAQGERSLGFRMFDLLVFEPMHFIMERRMMENVKTLAEGGHVLWVIESMHVGLWTVCAIVALFSLVLLFRRGPWRLAWAALASALLSLLLLTLVQPPLALGALLVIALVRLVWCARAAKRTDEHYVSHAPPPLLSRGMLR